MNEEAIPIAIGVMLLLVGLVWASQGAGMIGGSSLMDHNATFVYLGGLIAVIGVALLAFGALSRPNPKAATPM